MKDFDPKTISDRWLIESVDSDMGLWWLADDVRESIGTDASEEEVRTMTLQMLRPLLEKGKLRAADVFTDGTFKLWQGTIDEQLARIEEGWKLAGRPGLYDVVWFVGDRS